MASTPSESAATRLSQTTVESAISALLKFKAKQQSSTDKLQLLPQDDFVYLNITLQKIPSKSRTNPFKISLPHPILDSTSELCLIIDDRPQTPTPPSDQIKKLIKSNNIPISKVIKISKLKTNYKPFEAKRKLCDSYDMFLVDKRVVHLLPKLIGKEFFKKKKLPLAVDLSKKNLKLQVERALGSALLYMRSGTCCVMKVGKLAMEKDEIVENVVDAIKGAVEKVPKNWDGVRSLHLKFSDSVALPIFQAMPDVKLKTEEEEIEMKAVVAKVSASEGESVEKVVKSGKKKKGRIHEVRYMDVGDGIDNADGKVDGNELVRGENGDELVREVRTEGNMIEEIDDDIEGEDLYVGKTVGKKRKVSEEKKAEKKAKAEKSEAKKPKKIELSGEFGEKKSKAENSGAKKPKKTEMSIGIESGEKKAIADKRGAKTPKKTELSGGIESGGRKVKAEKNRTKTPKKTELLSGIESGEKAKAEKSGTKKPKKTELSGGLEFGEKKSKAETSEAKKSKKTQLSVGIESGEKREKAEKSRAKTLKKTELSVGNESGEKKGKAEKSTTKTPKKTEVSGGIESGEKKAKAEESGTKKSMKTELSGGIELGEKKSKAEKSGATKPKKTELSVGIESGEKKVKAEKSGAKTPKKTELSGGIESGEKTTKAEKSRTKTPKKTELSGGIESGEKKAKAEKSRTKKPKKTELLGGIESGDKKAKKKSQLGKRSSEQVFKVKETKQKSKIIKIQ